MQTNDTTKFSQKKSDLRQMMRHSSRKSQEPPGAGRCPTFRWRWIQSIRAQACVCCSATWRRMWNYIIAPNLIWPPKRRPRIRNQNATGDTGADTLPSWQSYCMPPTWDLGLPTISSCLPSGREGNIWSLGLAASVRKPQFKSSVQVSKAKRSKVIFTKN